MSQSEENTLKAAELVRFLLFVDRKKVPIKKQDIIKHVLKGDGRSFASTMAAAKAKLSDTFGIEVEELHDKNGAFKGFILVNGLNTGHEVVDIRGHSNGNSALTALLMIILSLLFMNGSMSEATLWHALKRLGIERGRNHEVFGNVENLLTTEFVKQMYLEREKVVNAEGQPSFTYKIGLRTFKEVSQRDILQFVADIYGTDIQAWKSHYAQVLEAEGHAATA